MLKRTLAIAFSAAFATAMFVAPMEPAYAQMAAPAKESTKSKKESAKKELTPQQQKMKDCAAKWRRGEEGQEGERPEGLQRIHEHVPEGLTLTRPPKSKAPRARRGGFALGGSSPSDRGHRRETEIIGDLPPSQLVRLATSQARQDLNRPVKAGPKNRIREG